MNVIFDFQSGSIFFTHFWKAVLTFGVVRDRVGLGFTPSSTGSYSNNSWKSYNIHCAKIYFALIWICSYCKNGALGLTVTGSLAASNAIWMRAMPLSREGVEAWWLVILPIVMETLGGFHKVAAWYDGTNKRRNKVFIHFPTSLSPLFLRISSGTAQDL